ncbi:MAG TPA: cyclic nucleotide-binding domain-containing protein [Kofleriaceae bacterium]|jgi:CRP-like cAMP-binding protein
MELESVLATLSLFEHLRADEIARIARRFAREELGSGARLAYRDARLVVVVRGAVDIEVDQSGTPLRARMATGDRFGSHALVTGYVRPFAVTARAPSTIAMLDTAAFERVLAEFPAVALPLSRETAAELAARDDFLRQLLELLAADLPAEELTAAIDKRRLAQQRRGARVTRGTTRGLFRRLVIDGGAEPAFWMLVGFVASLSGARLVVHLILKYGLEKRLFALVPGTDPNPMHIHHFNYGLLLVGATGLVALFPLGRRALRGLAFVFGLGAGLVFDEFALFWNLDPEYAQRLSLVAAGIAAAVLLQLIYFRAFWIAIVRRAWLQLRGAR